MYKVVLIDDEEIILHLMKNMPVWDEFGCVVVGESLDATEGHMVISQLKPDIVFCDIRMPGIDGLSMLGSLRSEFPDLQMVVMSGYREFEYAHRAIELGVSAYLIKPLDSEMVGQALERIVPRLKPALAEVDSLVVRTALSYIENNCTQKVTLQDVADYSYVSQWHLSKLLRKHTGKTFLQLVHCERVEMAKEMLKNPALRVSDVGERLGFADVSHFSKVFKRNTGMSPREYRNKMEE